MNDIIIEHKCGRKIYLTALEKKKRCPECKEMVFREGHYQ